MSKPLIDIHRVVASEPFTAVLIAAFAFAAWTLVGDESTGHSFDPDDTAAVGVLMSEPPPSIAPRVREVHQACGRMPVGDRADFLAGVLADPSLTPADAQRIRGDVAWLMRVPMWPGLDD